MKWMSLNWCRRCSCFMTRWTWTHLNSAIKVQSGQPGPPEVSRPRKPIQPPNGVTANTGTPHRGPSYLHCTWIHRTQLIMWVWTSGAAVSPCSRTHATANGHTFIRADAVLQRPGALPGNGWQPGMHTRFLLFFQQPWPPPRRRFFLFVCLFSFAMLNKCWLHGSGCVRGSDACKCALTDAESAFLK